jgi:hypothetical protein
MIYLAIASGARGEREEEKRGEKRGDTRARQ